MKDRLKTILPSSLVRRLLILNRLRWITKLRILRGSRARLRDHPVRNLAYVLWDPEVESFSYDIENSDEVAAFVGDLLRVEVAVVAGYIGEVERDPELNELLQRRMRWRFDVKTKLPVGNRILWYAIARALKPALIVEAGVYHGLGSLTLLRALERNAEEGAPGELISIDPEPSSGFIVPNHLRGRWRKVLGLSGEVLPELLQSREVGMLIHDTPHTYENARAEFDAAAAHAGDRLVLIDSGAGINDALLEVTQEHGGILRRFRERPKDHFYAALGCGVGVIERPSALGPASQ